MKHEELVKLFRTYRPEMLTEQETEEAADLIEKQAEDIRVLRELLETYRDDVVFRIGCASPYRKVAQDYSDRVKEALEATKND